MIRLGRLLEEHPDVADKLGDVPVNVRLAAQTMHRQSEHSAASDSDNARSDGFRYEAGKRVRSEVLGEDHVERSLARVTPFSQPIQELVAGLLSLV